MELIYKDDWDEARRRIDAWWEGEIIDRVPIKITAPIQKREIKKDKSWSLSMDNLKGYFTDLQSDSSCLISPKDFNELILPSIEQQTEWIGRTMYHLDGPDAIRHLDSLLSLPKLSGIQWIPGAGSPPMSEWIPLLKRIQKAGKLQHLICQKGEVRKLLRELEPEGILLDTICGSMKEAIQLISEVRRWI